MVQVLGNVTDFFRAVAQNTRVTTAAKRRLKNTYSYVYLLFLVATEH